MRALIIAYLDQPDDYATGLRLLEQTGFSGFALKVLQMGPDAYNQKRIIDELTAYLATVPEVVPEPTPVPIASIQPAVAPPVATVPLGDPLEELTMPLLSQAYALMDSRSDLKSQIRAIAQEESRQADRRDKAYQIKAITRQIDELYGQIDFVKQYGYMPPSEAFRLEVDDAALLMNVRTYVSRYRKKLKGLAENDPRFCTTEALLKQYEDQKNQLELKLKSKQPDDPDPTRQQT